MNKLKLIQTTEYLLLAAMDKQINHPKGSYVVSSADNKLYKNGIADYNGPEIIAHLPLNNAPVLEGISLLPRLQQKNAAKKYAKENYGEGYYPDIEKAYKAASKKWSDEDMKKGMLGYAKWLTGGPKSMSFAATAETAMKRILQSLSSRLIPIGFEPEYLNELSAYYKNGLGGKNELKIVNGVLQGIYKF